MVTIVENNDMSKAESDEIAVLDFSATWCAPCRMLAPVLEKISEKMKDKANFYNIDCDANEELSRKFGIVSIPAIIILKKGEKVDMSVGFVPEENLTDFIKKHIQ